jgi:hypothetical protein
MTQGDGWRRVGRERPCPVCKKPDWCAISTDGAVALCHRVESQRRIGEAGCLHRLQDSLTWRPMGRVIRSVNRGPVEGARSDLARLVTQFQAAVNPDQLERFALSLGLSVDSLRRLGIGWASEHRAWSFPLVDPQGRVLGIRLRNDRGFKWSVKGGREGLALPIHRTHRDQRDATQDSRLLICEGVTDTAALLDLGFENVVGRPSCTGGVKLLVELVKLLGRPEVVIVADGDEPGHHGADNLAAVLRAYVPSVRVISPPDGIKDVRAWLRSGGKHDDVAAAIAAATVQRGVICPRNRTWR